MLRRCFLQRVAEFFACGYGVRRYSYAPPQTQTQTDGEKDKADGTEAKTDGEENIKTVVEETEEKEEINQERIGTLIEGEPELQPPTITIPAQKPPKIDLVPRDTNKQSGFINVDDL